MPSFPRGPRAIEKGIGMKLGFIVGYSGAKMGGAIAQMTDADAVGMADNNGLPIAKVQEAEQLGYDSVWTAEAWGSDAVSPLAWIGAQTSKIKLGTGIMQIPGRSPANTAMTRPTPGFRSPRTQAKP